MATVNAGNIAKGDYLIFKDAPWQVMSAEFMNPGKGSAIMRVRFKNLKTGATQDFTYKTNETVQRADVEKKEMAFLYSDGTEANFMDPKTYDQATVPVSVVGDQIGFLIADLKVFVIWFEGEAIGVILPPHVVLNVVEAEEAIAGNRVNAPKKLVTVETGIQIQAPLFVKAGDRIEVDTMTGVYIARVNT